MYLTLTLTLTLQTQALPLGIFQEAGYSVETPSTLPAPPSLPVLDGSAGRDVVWTFEHPFRNGVALKSHQSINHIPGQ